MLVVDVWAAMVSDTMRRISSAVNAALALAGGSVESDEGSVTVVDGVGTHSGASVVKRLASSSRKICWTWLAV